MHWDPSYDPLPTIASAVLIAIATSAFAVQQSAKRSADEAELRTSLRTQSGRVTYCFEGVRESMVLRRTQLSGRVLEGLRLPISRVASVATPK